MAVRKGFFVLASLALLAAASLAILRGPAPSSWLPLLGTRDASKDAHAADLLQVSRLMGAPPASLIRLTDGRESSAEVLQALGSFRGTLLVVTAGRSTLSRRAENQPFISIAPAPGGGAAVAAPLLDPATATATASTVGPAANGLTGAADDAGLAALAAPLAVMNAAAAAVESVLGRRLFPVTLSLFDRTGPAGPYAIFDASAGSLLLDRGLVSYTWGADRPEVSYITSQLAGRVFTQASELLRGRRPGSGSGSGSGPGSEPGSGAAGSGSSQEGAAREEGGAEAARGGVEYEREDAEAAHGVGPGSSDAALLLPEAARRALLQRSGQEAAPDGSMPGAGGGGGLGADTAAAGSPPYLGASAAAAAVQLVGAAVGAALPAAFAAAPPLWFCMLCPTVLGLLAPVLINVALNQVAGALCTQLQLSDDQCFDVLLGALGVGFVLSLASAVPIFFVCRLPQCAGKNVTAALRRVAAWR